MGMADELTKKRLNVDDTLAQIGYWKISFIRVTLSSFSFSITGHMCVAGSRPHFLATRPFHTTGSVEVFMINPMRGALMSMSIKRSQSIIHSQALGFVGIRSALSEMVPWEKAVSRL